MRGGRRGLDDSLLSLGGMAVAHLLLFEQRPCVARTKGTVGMGNRVDRVYALCRQNDLANLAKALVKYKIYLADFERNPRMHSILHYIISVGGNANLCQVVYDYYGEKCLFRRDRVDATPLHAAAFHGNLTIVIWITNKIRESAALEYKTSGGETPLHWASYNGKSEILNALLKSGANVDTEDMSGDTPLHAAASVSSVSALLTLLHHGARIRKNQKGLFPHQVARGAHAKECSNLLRAHMYKNAKTTFNNQTIHEAIERAKMNVARRKVRMNGFGKKFIAVTKIIKVQKLKEKPLVAEKESATLKSKSSLSAMKDKVVSKTTEFTKHFSSMDFTSNPLFSKYGKNQVELVNPFSKSKKNANDDVNSEVNADAKSDDAASDVDVRKRPKGNWVLLSELPKDVHVKKGIVTDVPIIFKSNYKGGDEIYVEIPSTRRSNSFLYAATAIIPDEATYGDTLHLVMTLNDEGVPMATGRSVEYLSDNLDKELTGSSITDKSKSGRESKSPLVDSVDGVKVCAM